MITFKDQVRMVNNLREDLKNAEYALQVFLKERNSKLLGITFDKKTPIEILKLPERTYNALIKAGLSSVEELQIKPISELRNVKDIGDKGLQFLLSACQEKGINLAVTT